MGALIQYYKYELVLTPTECSTFYGANVTGVKKNSKIRLEVSCYSCNHQVFKLICDESFHNVKCNYNSARPNGSFNTIL